MKNSSRLLVKIARKRRRSSSGIASSAAWASTRWLNSSHERSRLKKRGPGRWRGSAEVVGVVVVITKRKVRRRELESTNPFCAGRAECGRATGGLGHADGLHAGRAVVLEPCLQGGRDVAGH